MVSIREVEERFDECWYCGHGLRAKPWVHEPGCPRYQPPVQVPSPRQEWLSRDLPPADAVDASELLIPLPLKPVGFAMAMTSAEVQEPPYIETVRFRRFKGVDQERGTWCWVWDLPQ